ncbi:MAG: F0F1 ATP synthase subunit B [Patescibacteria group bacterium]|jgi:F-type H+-transporting ATPase subunit b
MDLIHAALAAEEVASGGVAGTLGLNLTLFFAQLLNFGLLIVALWFLLFRPLTTYMAERSERIQSGLENAEKADRKLAELEAERRRVVAKAEEEASRILSKADDEAKRVVTDAVAAAEEKVQTVRDRAVKELAEAKEKLLTEVRAEAADLVTLAAEKVLQGRVDAHLDKALVAKALKEVSKAV